MATIPILKEREAQIYCKGEDRPFDMSCGKQSLAGSISQRACVFCGSRVVLYPIADALPQVHGPIGCAAYTWDIRGALSSGPQLHRLSFCSDLQDQDVIFGGEEKLYASLTELIGRGGAGTQVAAHSINILGELNIGGEAWVIRNYYERMGIQVVSVMTGDGRVDEIGRSHKAGLNVVQCSGSMTYLAKMMEETFGIPLIRASYFGIEDMSKALYDVAAHFHENLAIMAAAKDIVREEVSSLYPLLKHYRKDLLGKKAAIYVGGAFKAFPLIKALRHIGMDVVLTGSQTGNPEDYALLKDLCDGGTVIVDDASALELSK
jgi:nitrogenase molybdenum-iron protein alpha/beta subunit